MHFWIILTYLDPFLTHFNVFGSISDYLDQFLITFVLFPLIWTHFLSISDPFQLLWTCFWSISYYLDPFLTIWTNFWLFGPIVTYLDPFLIIWTHFHSFQDVLLPVFHSLNYRGTPCTKKPTTICFGSQPIWGGGQSCIQYILDVRICCFEEKSL